MHPNSLKNRVKSCQTQSIMNFIMMCVYFVSIFVKQQTIQHECIKHLNQMNVSFILFFKVKKLIIHMRHNTLLAKISCTLHTQLRMFSCKQLRIFFSRDYINPIKDKLPLHNSFSNITIQRSIFAQYSSIGHQTFV